jgi:hypothetical protein
MMARRKGFEPLTPRFEVWCSIQLSYRRLVSREQNSGAPAAIRAPAPQFVVGGRSLKSLNFVTTHSLKLPLEF